MSASTTAPHPTGTIKMVDVRKESVVGWSDGGGGLIVVVVWGATLSEDLVGVGTGVCTVDSAVIIGE